MTKESIELTSETFDQKISKGMWIVDFWAEWCGPCKMMEPHFEEAAKEFKGKVHFGKVDVDTETELSERFEVLSIPTIMIFKNNELVNRVAGALPKEEIIALIEESS